MEQQGNFRQQFKTLQWNNTVISYNSLKVLQWNNTVILDNSLKALQWNNMVIQTTVNSSAME